MSTILLRGATVVSDGRSFAGDILVAGETIVAAGKNVAIPAAPDRVIDATGCEIFPGGVDPHVHLELETANGASSDDFASGSRAALAGGTTTLLDFVTPRRDESLLAALASRRAAASRSLCDFGLHMSVTAWDGKRLPELEACCGREGILSVKTYLAYKESIGLDDGEFLAVLDLARRLDFLVMVHAEDGDMIAYLQRRLLERGQAAAASHPLSRPAEVEGDAVSRALLMARLAGVPLYVVHVSTSQGLDAVGAARQAGQAAIAETCPQYLLLDESRYRGDALTAALHVMSPPLRAAEHGAALWEALASGVIQVLASDHCPFTSEQKQRFALSDFTRIPGGAGGIEYRLALLYTFGVLTGRITLARFVDLVSTKAAKIFGLYPRKGTIRPGSDADLVVWDPRRRSTIAGARQWQRSDHTIYEGLELRGGPRLVMRRGTVVYEEGRILPDAGCGTYLARSRRPDHGSER